jgi:hypothetical protein
MVKVRWLRSTCVLAFALTASSATAAETPLAAQARACNGVPTAEWAGTRLTDQADIRSIQEIKSEAPVSEAETVVPRGGARLLLRAQPGITAEWLQRIAECHMSQVATSSPSMLTASPLDVKGALVSVQSAGDGFAVDITSADRKIAREILRRAKSLAPPPAAAAR